MACICVPALTHMSVYANSCYLSNVVYCLGDRAEISAEIRWVESEGC